MERARQWEIIINVERETKTGTETGKVKTDSETLPVCLSVSLAVALYKVIMPDCWWEIMDGLLISMVGETLINKKIKSSWPAWCSGRTLGVYQVLFYTVLFGNALPYVYVWSHSSYIKTVRWTYSIFLDVYMCFCMYFGIFWSSFILIFWGGFPTSLQFYYLKYLGLWKHFS